MTEEQVLNYIKEVLEGQHHMISMIKVKIEDGKSFGTIAQHDPGKYMFIVAPKDKRIDGWFVKLTLRHEIGHCILHYLYQYRHDVLSKMVERIRSHKWFRRFQLFWYWSPFLRIIRRFLGFSGITGYKKTDWYGAMKDFTMADVELFCDYFAARCKTYKRLEEKTT